MMEKTTIGHGEGNYSGGTDESDIYTSPIVPHPFPPGQLVRRNDGQLQVVCEVYPSGISASFLELRQGVIANSGYVCTMLTGEVDDFAVAGGGSTERTDNSELTARRLSPRELAEVQIKVQGLDGLIDLENPDVRVRGKAKYVTLLAAEQFIAHRIVSDEPVSQTGLTIDSNRQNRVRESTGYVRPNYGDYAEIDVEAVLAAAGGEDL